jgi:hypothetical protein
MYARQTVIRLNTLRRLLQGAKRVCLSRTLVACAAMLVMVSSAGAAGTDRAGTIDANSLDILTAAFGLERFKEYTANQNALAYGYRHLVGVEASYMDLGESKFAGQSPGESDDRSDVGGRVDLRFAFDVSAPIARNARVFSRMGIYYWDLDVNYNRVSNDFNASQGGNGQVVSVGAAFHAGATRLSVELEQVDRDSVIATRDVNRVLINVSSKF